MTAEAMQRGTRSRSRSPDRRRDRSRSRERRRERSRDRRWSPERSRRDERARDSRLERRDRSRSRSPRRGDRPRSPRRHERQAEGSYRGRSKSPGDRREGGGYRSERARGEDRLARDSSREREQRAMPAPERRGPGACFKCGEEGHMARDCPNAPPGGGGGRGPCYKCGEEGHIARDCPNPEAAGAGPGGRRRRRDEGDDGGNMAWGKPGEQEEEAPPDKEVEPEFGLSGALAAETNRVNGVVLVHQEPPEARKPTARWRLYVFKNGEPFGDPLHIHRMSSYLFGRERRVVDVPTDHPSCSKQHAVLQFRLTEKEGADGMMKGAVRPYLMDLGSTNGTFLNGERLEPERYYELLEKDLVRFGNSTREYVLLKEK